MRLALYVTCGILGVFGVGWLVFAQGDSGQFSLAPPTDPNLNKTIQTRRITVSEVVVHSGPSDKTYATSKLRKDTDVYVVVDHTTPKGWLAILPPVGSFSWVNARKVENISKSLYYVPPGSGTAVVKAGSYLHKGAPNQKSTELSTGAIVLYRGRTKEIGGEKWLETEPVAGEVRYIPEQAVAGSEVRPYPPTETMIQNYITQANRAMSLGNVNEAQKLFHTASLHACKYTDKLKCWHKLDVLNQINGRSTPVYQPGNPQHYAVAQRQVKAQFANQRKVVSYSTTKRPSTKLSFAADTAPGWTQWGYLRKSTVTHQGQTMYMLVDRSGNPIHYAITTPNLTLEPYVNRLVCLYGPQSHRGNNYVRGSIVLVSHVSLP